MNTSRKSMRRDREVCFIVREGGRSSIPETPVTEPKSRGVLDRPVKPGDDKLVVWRRMTMMIAVGSYFGGFGWRPTTFCSSPGVRFARASTKRSRI